VITIQSCVSASPNSRTVDNSDEQAPIENPFGNFKAAPASQASHNITLRSKRGDQSVEVDLPQNDASDLSVPMNQKFSNHANGVDAAIGETAENGVDYQYMKQKPTIADREIASTFSSQDDGVDGAKKREIENALGLQESDEPIDMDESYLAKLDVIKQLFHNGRFEAALIEIDRLVRTYPTSGRLYEMRGTLLDRLGYADLAMKSWKQALEFEPRKLSLKKLIEKREAQRSVASEKQ
jgi:tetratricopeptide (TPR) repeat protein